MLGTVGGVGLAVLVCAALMKSAAPPVISVSPITQSAAQREAQQQARERLLEFIQSNYTDNPELFNTSAAEFLDTTKTPAIYLAIKNGYRQMTLGELLSLRQQALSQAERLYIDLGAVRNSFLKSYSSQFSFRRINYSYVVVNLAESQAKLLSAVDLTQLTLANLQLSYLRQRQAPADTSMSGLRIRLAQLQLQNTQGGRAATLWELKQRKLALANAIQLRQADLTPPQKSIIGPVLDSCQREVALLRRLDIYQARQDSIAPLVNDFSAEASFLDFPSGASASMLAPARQPSTTDWTGLQRTALLLFALLILFLPLGLAAWGMVDTRRKLKTGAAPPPQEQEPLTLQLLLQAYAGKIRAVLRTPRQIKRFASKARLQHHLLGALARQQNSFTFGPTEQVLAFTLLLLIEEDGRGSSKLSQESSEFTQQLCDLYLLACAAGELDAEVPQRFLFKQGQGWFHLNRGPSPAQNAPLDFIASLETSNADQQHETLLYQLYWMNAGLLV